MRSLLTLACVSYSLLAPAHGANDEPLPKLPLWQAELGGSAKITLAVSQIVSVTMHPFLLDGTRLITEVTIDTTGNNSIRIYYIHTEEEEADLSDPASVARSVRKHAARHAASALQEDPAFPGVKYPEGVYAHTIEYQVKSLDALEDLYKSLVSVWEQSAKKRTTFKVSDK